MYRKHFALTRHPFDKDIAPDDLFPSASLVELGARLKHLVDMRGIGLVTGDSGSGKTTTCRHLVAGLHTGLFRIMYVSMTTGNVMDLYKSIAWELGLPTERNRAALFRQIRGEVSRLCAENRLRPVLIVDEAHHLRTDLLEGLRLLTSHAMDSENRLTVVLVGHPELRRRMGMAALDALAQRMRSALQHAQLVTLYVQLEQRDAADALGMQILVERAHADLLARALVDAEVVEPPLRH